MKLIDKIQLRRCSLIEMVNGHLKNISQIEHSGNRSLRNCLLNLFTRLIAHTYLPEKYSLNLELKCQFILLTAVFKQPNHCSFYSWRLLFKII